MTFFSESDDYRERSLNIQMSQVNKDKQYHSILQLLIRESRENKQVQELPERLCKNCFPLCLKMLIGALFSHAFADITICNRIYLTHLSLSSFLRDRDKQYRPGSDAAGRGV